MLSGVIRALQETRGALPRPRRKSRRARIHFICEVDFDLQPIPFAKGADQVFEQAAALNWKRHGIRLSSLQTRIVIAPSVRTSFRAHAGKLRLYRTPGSSIDRA